MAGSDVDIARFPAPIWHRHDGGPFIGSGSLVVMRDPDSGWINASIYRVQVHGPNKVTVQFDHGGRHGAIIAKKYWDRGESCPVAVVHGEDPALFIAGFEYLPDGRSEYDFAGAIKGAPIEVLRRPADRPAGAGARGDRVRRPLVADGRERRCRKDRSANSPAIMPAAARPGPVMEVTAIHHRNDPILLGSPPMKPPRFHFGLPFRAATIWSNLEARRHRRRRRLAARVATHDGRGIAPALRRPCQARRAGCGGAQLHGAHRRRRRRRYRSVDLADVMWAVATRCEPAEGIDIIRNAWSSALDPRIPPEDKERGVTSHSKVIIDACRPFAWIDKFPKTSALSADEAREIEEKWGKALSGAARK